MKLVLIFLLSSFNFSLLATEANDIQFVQKVKQQIRERFRSGKKVYEYDKGVLVKTWRNKNMSGADIRDLVLAYKDATEIERRLILKEKLDKKKYIYTEFPEGIKPLLPNVTK
jgi:hypothetical protein